VSVLRTLGVVLVAVLPSPVAAQLEAPHFVAVDEDDDDDDGVRDGEQERPPLEDAVVIEVGAGVLRWSSGRVFRGRTELRSPARVRAGRVRLMATEVGEIGLGLDAAQTTLRAIRLRFVGGDGVPLDPRRDALAPTQRIPNDATLPRSDTDRADPRDVRIVVEGVSDAELEVTSQGELQRDRLLSRVSRGRSPWLRLVADRLDDEAPDVSGRLLWVALRDRVEARIGQARQSLRVGRPGSEDGPLAARRGTLRVRVLRHRGVPAVGTTEARAMALAREQVAIANEIWAQCLLDFGAPHEADVAVVDAPGPWMVAIGDPEGMPARGGTLRIRAGERSIRLDVAAGSTPVQTALALADVLRAEGFDADVRANPRTERGTDRSADVLVSRGGQPVALSPEPGSPLTTDLWQTVAIGGVDLADGLQEFSNENAAAGTLEERALLHGVGDGDPTTIEVVVVGHFSARTRQGEAFIESDQSAVLNAVLLDRTGVRLQRAAWTQSHELGHVLLDQPFHPDNVGADRPWLLMDSNASAPTLRGPRRLTPEDCARVRRRSGVNATPPLLRRYPSETRRTAVR